MWCGPYYLNKTISLWWATYLQDYFNPFNSDFSIEMFKFWNKTSFYPHIGEFLPLILNNNEQFSPWSEDSSRFPLIWVYTFCNGCEKSVSSAVRSSTLVFIDMRFLTPLVRRLLKHVDTGVMSQLFISHTVVLKQLKICVFLSSITFIVNNSKNSVWSNGLK